MYSTIKWAFCCWKWANFMGFSKDNWNGLI